MKIKKIIFPISLAIILLSISSCSMFKKTGANDAFTLKYGFGPGQEVEVNTVLESNFESEQMGQQVSIDVNSTSVLGFKSLAVEEGNIDMEMEFVDMTQSMDGPMGSGETDFTELLGKKTSFSLAPLGETSEMKGFDELPGITNVLGETLDGDMYQVVVGSIFFKLPDHPVKLGDSWTIEDNLEIPYGGGSLKTETNTTYLVTEKLKVDGMDCLRMDVTGKVKTSGNFEQNGMQLSMERNATSTGNLIFAIDKGMFLSADSKSTTIGEVDVPAAGMKIPQKITASTKSTVVFK